MGTLCPAAGPIKLTSCPLNYHFSDQKQISKFMINDTISAYLIQEVLKFSSGVEVQLCNNILGLDKPGFMDNIITSS